MGRCYEKGLTWGTEAYKPDPKSPEGYALLNPKGHKGLPKAYIQICGMDPLRDDGLIYEEVLRENGVKTRIDIYPGLPHEFWLFLTQLESSKKWKREFVEGVRWLLES